MDAADLGILRWDPDRQAIAAMFGDNFDFVGLRGEWQSPSIVMYDRDYNVRGIPASNGTIRPNARRSSYGPMNTTTRNTRQSCPATSSESGTGGTSQ